MKTRPSVTALNSYKAGLCGNSSSRFFKVGWGLLLAVTLLMSWPASAAPATPGRVLILADTLWDRINGTPIGPANFDPRNSLEVQIATGLGFIVDFAYNGAPSGVAFAPSGLIGTRRQWSTIPASLGASPFGFSDYRAILLCDPLCNGSISAVSGPTANTAVWGPVIGGNTIFDGEDFDYHCPSQPGACTYLTNVFKFVTGGGNTCTNKTGLYVSFSCFYAGAPPGTAVPVLNYFGSFTVRGGGYNAITIVATHPALAAITSATLSGYSSSCHETFDTWPAGFTPLAIVTDPGAPKLVTGGNPVTNGAPYILAHSCDGLLVPTGPGCCMNITNKALDCVVTNKTYAWQFCITNCSTDGIKYLSFPDLGSSGVSPNQDLITLPSVLYPGQGTCLTVYLTNTTSLTNVCFTIGGHSTNLTVCCAITNCLTFTPCCVNFANESVAPIPGTGCYNYTFTFKNLTVPPVPIKYLILVQDPAPPPNCITFTPDIVTLGPLAPGASTIISVKVCIAAGCKGPFCFLAGAVDTNLVNCCSTRHCIPPGGPKPIAFAGGFDGRVFEEGTLISVPIAIDTTTVRPTHITLYDGGAVLYSADTTISNSTVLSVTWSNAAVGTHTLRADEVDTLNAVWASEPATIYVVEDQHSGGPIAPTLTDSHIENGRVVFSVLTHPSTTIYTECSDSLTAPNWHVIEARAGDGTIQMLNYSCTNTPQQFYRLRIQ